MWIPPKMKSSPDKKYIYIYIEEHMENLRLLALSDSFVNRKMESVL